jgi:hypothetical protein
MTGRVAGHPATITAIKQLTSPLYGSFMTEKKKKQKENVEKRQLGKTGCCCWCLHHVTSVEGSHIIFTVATTVIKSAIQFAHPEMIQER